jgi:hypothetical protein
MSETLSPRRSYKDMAEYGYSIHYLLEQFAYNLREGERATVVGSYYLHHAKREMRRLSYIDCTLTNRDILIAEFAVAVAQFIVAHTYNRHAMGTLNTDEIYSVPPPRW